MQIIQKIGIYVGLLLYATTAMGQNDTPTAASDTLAAEEQQQFLYYFSFQSFKIAEFMVYYFILYEFLR